MAGGHVVPGAVGRLLNPSLSLQGPRGRHDQSDGPDSPAGSEPARADRGPAVSLFSPCGERGSPGPPSRHQGPCPGLGLSWGSGLLEDSQLLTSGPLCLRLLPLGTGRPVLCWCPGHWLPLGPLPARGHQAPAIALVGAPEETRAGFPGSPRPVPLAAGAPSSISSPSGSPWSRQARCFHSRPPAWASEVRSRPTRHRVGPGARSPAPDELTLHSGLQLPAAHVLLGPAGEREDRPVPCACSSCVPGVAPR